MIQLSTIKTGSDYEIVIVSNKNDNRELNNKYPDQ